MKIILNVPYQYDYNTKEDHLRLKTKANKDDVQKVIYDWLEIRVNGKEGQNDM